MHRVRKQTIALGLVLVLAGTAWAIQKIENVVFPGNGTMRLPWANAGSTTEANRTTIYAATDGSLHFKPHGGTDVALGAGDVSEVQVGTGLSVANGTGPIPVISLDADLQALAGIAGVRGDIIFHNGTTWVRLPASSTDGFVLSSEGSDEDPLWIVPSAGTITEVVETGGALSVSGGTGPTVTLSADEELEDVAALTPTDNGVIIGNGTAFVVESGATLKTSLGLTIGLNVSGWSARLDDVGAVSPTVDNFVGGTGTILAMRTPAQVRASLGLAVSGDGSGDITSVTESGDAIVISGGTGPTPDISAHAAVEGIADGVYTDNFVLAGNGTIPVAQTLTSLIDEALGSTRGSLLRRGATGWEIVTPGTADLPLVSNGVGADPAYEVLALAGGGTGATDSSGARTALGVSIGVNVQAFDSDLTELGAIAGSQGDIIFHNGTDWVRLPPAGTDGFLLSSEGADEDPIWIAPPAASGDLTEVQETGDAIIIASGTGPIPSFSAHANVEVVADAAVTADTFLGGTGAVLAMRTEAQVKTSLGLETTSTDNAIARFNGTTGGTQNSTPTIQDDGSIKVNASHYASTVVSCSDATAIDPRDGAVQTLTLSGNQTFGFEAAALEASVGKAVVLYVTGDGSIRTLTFDADWLFPTGNMPATLAANAKASLHLTSTSNADTGIYAVWTVWE